MGYKSRSQWRWSKALVRYGADPGTALAKILDVPAENIQVKEDAVSEPPFYVQYAPHHRPQ